MRIDAVWDIETAEWDQFLCGALWVRDHGMNIYRSADDLASAILSLPAGTEVWAHAGGKFDVLWLIDHVSRRSTPPEAQVNMSGGSATSVRFKGGPWLRDSARLVPMSLKKAAAIAGVTKGTPGLPCVCERSCGGYCSQRRDMPESHWRLLEEYLANDVDILRRVLDRLVEYSAANGITLRGTIGGSAWATVQAWCGVAPVEWAMPLYKLAAEAYYGGRCEAPILVAGKVWRYDRHAAYPSAICEPVPTGEPRLCMGSRAARRAYTSGRPGAFRAALDVPQSNAPPLPVRLRERLAYPWGRVHGVWTDLELRRAEERGARILDITEAVVWPLAEPVLRTYAERIFALREQADSDGLKTWLKFAANSPTGKFGQSPDMDLVRLGDLADDPGYRQVGRSPYVWARSIWRIPDCAHVEYAMTLTSRNRVELDNQIDHAGDAWAYSDTDSVYATKPLTRRVGDALGEWGFEGEGIAWECRAPKVYYYWDAAKQKAIAHAKGVPDAEDPDVWTRYARGETVVVDRGVKTLLVAARGDATKPEDDRLFARRRLTRSLHEDPTWCGARLRDKHHRTRAPHVSRLKELA